MTHLNQSSIQLLNDRSVFEEIHQLKSSFISLFSELGNEIPSDYLSAIHPSSQGIKISKGNELEHCPYQVLDIIRDFDKEKGFNVRILNWWGRGLFLFVFMGKNNKRLMQYQEFISEMHFHGYLLAKTTSPWDYKRMIDVKCLEALLDREQLIEHLRNYKYLQMVKQIVYSEDVVQLKESLNEQIGHIFKFYEE